LAFGLALAMTVLARGARKKNQSLARLQPRQRTVGSNSNEEMETSRKFFEMIRYWSRRLPDIFPWIERLESSVKIEERLTLAGNPFGLTAKEFLGFKVFSGLALATGMAILSMNLFGILSFPFFFLVGLFLPEIWLRRVLWKRTRDLNSVLPDMIDILTILVTAGLNLNLALPKVTEKLTGVLGVETKRLVQEMEFGLPRAEALENLLKRNKSDQLKSFISVLIQAERYGQPVATVLKIQSKQAREVRRKKAEELARKAPVKLLFPLIFLILPAFILLTVGTTLISMIN
jgi:tight adherence protein C